VGISVQVIRNIPEFTAYRILYTVFLMGNSKYEGGSSDMYELLQEVHQDKDVVSSREVSHALRVRTAVATDDFNTFFKLLKTASKMSGYLMQLVAPKMRYDGLKQIIKTYVASERSERAVRTPAGATTRHIRIARFVIGVAEPPFTRCLLCVLLSLL